MPTALRKNGMRVFRFDDGIRPSWGRSPTCPTKHEQRGSLVKDLFHASFELVHFVLVDHAMVDEDRVVLGDVGVPLQHIYLAMGEAGKNLDRLVAELERILHDGAGNLAAANTLQRLRVLIEGDDDRFIYILAIA